MRINALIVFIYLLILKKRTFVKKTIKTAGGFRPLWVGWCIKRRHRALLCRHRLIRTHSCVTVVTHNWTTASFIAMLWMLRSRLYSPVRKKRIPRAAAVPTRVYYDATVPNIILLVPAIHLIHIVRRRNFSGCLAAHTGKDASIIRRSLWEGEVLRFYTIVRHRPVLHFQSTRDVEYRR